MNACIVDAQGKEATAGQAFSTVDTTSNGALCLHAKWRGAHPSSFFFLEAPGQAFSNANTILDDVFLLHAT
eukprot:5211087-Ditylum_brightwellii.AAC.2